jgi:hypothetical protein
MEEQRERAYRVVAFAAVACSIIAVLAVSTTVPFVYHFVDHVAQQTKRDLNFCKVIWYYFADRTACRAPPEISSARSVPGERSPQWPLTALGGRRRAAMAAADRVIPVDPDLPVPTANPVHQALLADPVS